jgi:hypothetical protein
LALPVGEQGLSLRAVVVVVLGCLLGSLVRDITASRALLGRLRVSYLALTLTVSRTGTDHGNPTV